MSDQRADHEHRVRISAYQLWENDGRPDGHESRHWERAEKLCESHTLDRIQDPESSSSNNSALSVVFKNTTGEPDAPRYLNYKA